jgi:hypothetical protein
VRHGPGKIALVPHHRPRYGNIAPELAASFGTPTGHEERIEILDAESCGPLSLVIGGRYRLGANGMTRAGEGSFA